MYFTGSKDTDNLLISHLSAEDIINFILATPNNPLWTFENIKRFHPYLRVIPYFHREALFKAVKLSSLDKANLKNIKLFNQLSSGLFINDAFAIAIEIGNQTTIDYFLNSFELYWDGALKYVAKSGRKDWVDLVIDKGANDWVSGLEGAVEGGHLDLVKFFTTKKAGRSVDKYSGLKAFTKFITV